MGVIPDTLAGIITDRDLEVVAKVQQAEMMADGLTVAEAESSFEL